MDSHAISYGIISFVDLSYFLWFGSDALHISRGVEWLDQNFVVVLSYFLEKAANNTTAYAGKEGHESPQAFEYTFDEKEDNAVSDHKDKESMVKGASDLKEMPVERLHLERHPFAIGWSRNVVRGMYKGVACRYCYQACIGWD